MRYKKAVGRSNRITISISDDARDALQRGASRTGESMSKLASDMVQLGVPMLAAVLDAHERLEAAEDAYKHGGAAAVLQVARDFRAGLLQAEERAFQVAEASVLDADVDAVMRSRLRVVPDADR